MVGYPAIKATPQTLPNDTHGTTVLALRYDSGILNLGDRRAVMANYVMYDKAEKVLAIDDSTLIAISGSFARSTEIVRYLRHAFKYYARTQLQDLSLEGKLQEITRALAGNLPMAMDGIGLFIPVVSAYDASKDSFGIYFYDALGARFQSGEFAAAGSGSERIRGVFDYIQRERGLFESRSLSDVLKEGLTMLDIASQLDSATGGFDRMLPTAKTLTKTGISTVGIDNLQKAIKDMRRP